MNKADQIELVKARCVTLDESDAQRLFTTQTIFDNAKRGSIIALQFSGPDCIAKAKEMSQQICLEIGGASDMIYCSESEKLAQIEIDNLFKFINMQLGF